MQTTPNWNGYETDWTTTKYIKYKSSYSAQTFCVRVCLGGVEEL